MNASKGKHVAEPTKATLRAEYRALALIAAQRRIDEYKHTGFELGAL